MITQQSNTKKQLILIVIIIGITAIIAAFLLFSNKTQQSPATESKESTEQHADHDHESAHTHENRQEIELSNSQIASQQISIETANSGLIARYVSVPGRLLVNADQQAHVSPNFAGRVEAVYVQTGQTVKKGQPLASLLVPELVDLQANIQLMQSRLALAKSNYQREKTLWQQGISAKQDYLLAENSYQQASIELNAANTRINAYGAARDGVGRFTLKAPIAGVINRKDIVVGENVQTADQLFVIDRLDQLWLEFTVPVPLAEQLSQSLHQHTEVSFNIASQQQTFKAKLLNLTPSADLQTGRLIARALVDNSRLQLRPNMLVNVQVAQNENGQDKQVLVKASAVQQIDGRNIIFLAEKNNDGAHFVPHPVTVGESSTDRQWIAITDGLKQGEPYVSMGSFILKSELEKGEAEHEH